MQYTKEGDAKENTFLPWCRKIARLRMQVASTATEHAESSEAQEARWYKALALDLLSNESPPAQKGKERLWNLHWKIRRDKETGDIQVTDRQRSWINAMLRKKLGHTKVAFFIFNHGIPDLFDTPFRKKPPTRALLQSMLEDAMHWHASMLLSIVAYEDHPDMENARQLGALDQGAWRQQRQERKRQAKQRISQGSRLAMERDTEKRKYEDMSATEEHILEDFDTDKFSKDHDKACGQRMQTTASSSSTSHQYHHNDPRAPLLQSMVLVGSTD